jgi:short subunit dehydrogenase-like uncharacterized protein
MGSREFDVILYGATGYTGRLVAEHLARRLPADGVLNWALAGRDADTLQHMREAFGAAHAGIVVADLDDAPSLQALARRARVVGTAAGPYHRRGEALAQACAEAGTDYLDISAETAWIRHLIDRLSATARRTGARLIPCAGFDSIPSELGVLRIQQEATARFGRALPYVKGRILAMRSGMSGGSAATAAAITAAARADPAVAALYRNPFALTPGFDGPPQPDARTRRYDPDVAGDVGPFTMAPVNIKSVHRLNFLLGQPWGADFRYDEMALIHNGAPADFDRTQATQLAPGQGPAAEDRAAGFYKIRYLGLDSGQVRVSVLVEGDADPGYGSTAKIFGEAMIFIALDGDDGPGGVWTPGAIMGTRLLAPLEAHAGLTFTDES